MFTVTLPRYRLHAGPRRLTRRHYLRRPKMEQLENRYLLALSAFEILPPCGTVATAVSTQAELTSPLRSIEDVMPEGEQLEGRRLLSRASYPDLPAMRLVGPYVGQFDSQVVHLDFDGARDVIYGGPIVVEGIDVPSFRLPDDLAGQEQVVIDGLVDKIEEAFADTGITFTTQLPTTGEYSTVYIGGDASAFQEYGNFLGLAEQIDVGNRDRADSALVFSDLIMGGEGRAALPEVIVHEIGHLLGYAHLGDDAGVDSDLASVAHTTEGGWNDQGTHQFITKEASHLYQALFGVSGLPLELESYLAREGTDSPDTGNSIIEGVVEEDYYDLLSGVIRPLNHFSAGGDFTPTDELLDGYVDGVSAYTTAGLSMTNAFFEYNGGNTARAYWWLGRTMHLLQDSTVPAHVHNDGHLFNDEQYEVSVTPGVDSDYHNYFTFDPANGASWEFQDWVSEPGYWSLPAPVTDPPVTILGSSSQALWDRSDDYASLEAIFRETTDYTDDYDSDSEDGDCHNGVSGDHFNLDRLDQLKRSEPARLHHDWALAVEGDGPDLEPWEVSRVARDLGTWAVEQSALFMRFFYDQLGQVPTSPANMHIDRVGLSSIELGWGSVDGADGYIVFRSLDPHSGYTRVGSSLEPLYHDTELNRDTTYYYRVYSYNDVAGLGSGYSEASATTNPKHPDIDGDGDVNCVDVNLLSTEIATDGDNLAGYDFNGDGEVSLADLNEWLALAGEVNLGSGISYLQGDANLSGHVDVSDFNVWNSNKFTALGDGGGGGLWCSGDLNADGVVDVSDFNLWNAYKFTSSLPLTPVLLDFDAQDVGTFDHLNEDGFTLDYIGYGDHQEVADAGDGDLVLVDSNPYNTSGAEVIIRRTDGLTFFLDSLYASDLTNNPDTFSSARRIDVTGIRGGTWMQAVLTPISSTFTQYAPPSIVGRELDELRINLVSSSRDDFSVDDIKLMVAPAAGIPNVPPTLVLDPVSPVENGLAMLSSTIIDPGTLDTFTLDVDRSEPRALASVDRASAYDRLFAEPAGQIDSSPLVTWRSSVGRSDLDVTGDTHRQYPADERSDRNQEEESDMMAPDLDAVFALWKI